MSRIYYTKWDIFKMWVKKQLGIRSPSTIAITQGRYEYEWDRMFGGRKKTKVHREREDFE